MPAKKEPEVVDGPKAMKQTLVSVIGASIAWLDAVLTEIILETEGSFMAFGNFLSGFGYDIKSCKHFHGVIMP